MVKIFFKKRSTGTGSGTGPNFLTGSRSVLHVRARTVYSFVENLHCKMIHVVSQAACRSKRELRGTEEILN